MRNRVKAAREWNHCVASATNDRYQETHEVLETAAGQAGKKIIGFIGAGAMKAMKDSGLAKDLIRYHSSYNPYSYYGSRTWISEIGGKLRVGSAAFGTAIARQVGRGIGAGLYFETAAGLQATAVGLMTCTGG